MGPAGEGGDLAEPPGTEAHHGPEAEPQLALCEGFPITLGAQAHLQGWYEQFGFRLSGPGYVEDGIPHVPMRREAA